MAASSHADAAHVDYILHLADNAVVLGQRNGEWCGHGPVAAPFAIALSQYDCVVR